jgi:exoribonuclease-2
MLPPEVIEKLALGLNEQSPALSFGMDISDSGEVVGLEIVPSWVKVTRLTYDEVESRLSEPILGQLNDYALLSRKRRLANGAIELSLPEIKIRTVDGAVDIRPLPSLQSRELVREAMLMTGQAVAQYAVEHEIPMPFTTQEIPESYELDGETLSQMFAIRNRLRASQRKLHPGSHAGLGLDEYVQATSPLRRYLDLLVHQQLRAHISGSDPLHAEEILDRIGAIDEVVGSIRRAERNSNQHWTLVYLMQNPGWRGEAVVVGQRGARYQCLIPELAMDAGIYLGKDVELDTIVELSVEGIDLAFLEADFRLVE